MKEFPDDEIEQQLFVHVNPPPRQFGVTDMANDKPSRIATVSIVTGQRKERVLGESCQVSISKLDFPTQAMGILLIALYVLPMRSSTRLVSPGLATNDGSGRADAPSPVNVTRELAFETTMSTQ